MSHVLEQLQWRYATKKFDSGKKLSTEKLSILKTAFDLTATSFGLQPLKLVIVSEETIKQELVEFSFNQQMVGDCSHLLVLCIESEVNEQYIVDHFKLIQEVRQTPREILDPYQEYLIGHFGDKEKIEVDEWMTKQAYLAMGNLLTVCALEEIDACPMEGFQPAEYDRLLGLKERGLRSVLVMPVGYRHKEDMFSQLKKVRRGVEEVIVEI
ncbi:NAD(P)H-dependent oxidoreductase [Aureitalea marina]|uniref:NAD(P)H-dependent oxidoreductase n=1 Tax=Aureitalea marina TaxID=930804 RepID=A0A2S7KNF8_9FLAO|nr:NAD(P)H-dependent oxidoreductase [Aureitalea marina]PQB04130.1 NAD(P)H-dependent oxidoreductase [Aureitalea marina]